MLVIRVLLSGLGVLMLVIVTINAAFMIVSPRAWFHLPSWLRGTGSLTERRYASGWGAFQVRLVGVIWFAALGWFLFDAFFKQVAGR